MVCLGDYEIKKGEKIYYQIGWDTDSYTTDAIGIQNRLPIVTKLEIRLDNHTLRGVVNATDVDQDLLQYEFIWLENGSICSTGKNTLNLTTYQPGTEYIFKVRIFDGTDFTVWNETTPFILQPIEHTSDANFPPNQGSPTDSHGNSATPENSTNSNSEISNDIANQGTDDSDSLGNIWSMLKSPIDVIRDLFQTEYGWVIIITAIGVCLYTYHKKTGEAI